MGKKKGTHHQSKESKRLDVPHKNHAERWAASGETSMEDPARKVQDLKSVNDRLLTEIDEKKLKIESLLQEKIVLVNEMDRSDMERHFLEFELHNASEENVILGLEEIFMMVFMQAQFWELSCTVDRFAEEKREVEGKIEMLRIQLNEFLRNEAYKMRKLMRSMEENIGKLTTENAELGNENYIRKHVAEVLRGEIDVISKEKKAITMAKNSLMDDLEKELTFWKEIVFNSKNIENRLRKTISELEKNCGEAMDKEKEKEMKKRVAELIENKEAMEKRVAELIEEKDRLVDELTQEKKNSIMKSNLSKQNELTEIQIDANELSEALRISQESCIDHRAKNKQLIREVEGRKAGFDRVTKEKNDAWKSFEEERKKVMKLTFEAMEFEKKTDELRQKLVKMERENSTLIHNEKEKEKEKENRYESLRKEKEIVEKDLNNAMKRIDSLETNLASVENGSRRALSMLKNTSKLLFKSEDYYHDEDNDNDNDNHNDDDDDDEDEDEDDDVQHGSIHKQFAVELDAIEQAFYEQEESVTKTRFWFLLFSVIALFIAVVFGIVVQTE